MSLQFLIQRISDKLAYILVSGDDLCRDLTNLNKQFEPLRTNLQDLSAHLKHPAAHQWLALTLQEVEKAYSFFEQGDDEHGSRAIEIAEEYFERVLKGEQSKAKFAVDPDGNTAEFSDKKGS